MVSNLRMTVRLVAAALLLFLATSIRLNAACMPAPPTCVGFANADIVFYGEAIARRLYSEMREGGPIPEGINAVKFKVMRAYKGVKVGEFWGLFYFNSEVAPFATGNQYEYLVFANRSVTGAFHAHCALTRRIETRIGSGDQEWLRPITQELEACFKSWFPMGSTER